MDPDGHPFLITFAEIISFQHAGDGIFAGQIQHIHQIHILQPFTVIADNGFVFIQYLEYLFLISSGIDGDLFGA